MIPKRAHAPTGFMPNAAARAARPRLRSRGDRSAFFRAWLDAPLRTGAQMPSTHRLAAAMVRAAGIGPQARVVELGPGTGIVTQHLIAAGMDEADLVLIESNPAFCALLNERFPAATIIEGDAFERARALSLARAGDFTAVVSSLPLFVYPRENRVDLLDHALGLLAPGGRVIQFTYGTTSPFPLRADCAAKPSRRIWRNLWPAVVWRYSRAAPGPIAGCDSNEGQVETPPRSGVVRQAFKR